MTKSESNPEPLAPKLAVIGAGAMASAILEGAFGAGLLRPAEVVVVEPDESRRSAMAARGCAIIADAAPGAALRALAPDGAVLLATKPQSLADVARALGASPAFAGVVISILAGARSERVREAFGGSARVVRVMPNTPARIGLGVSAVASGAGAREGDDALALRLFGAVGEVVRVEETMMDAFTALAGSGPAYIFYLAEAMARAGVEMGFDPDDADRITRAVVRGSAELLARSPGESASALRAAVTSKGGTTEAATRSMDEAQVRESIVRAIVAARDRGAELSRLA